MNVRKLAALFAAVTIIIALAVGITPPANAQGWHHGGYYHHGPAAFHGGPGFHQGRPGFYHGGPGFYHGGPGFYHGGPVYRHYPVGYRRPVYYSRPAYYGPGYTHYSWAWYRNHPAYWRDAHPYHGSPTLGVWIHL